MKKLILILLALLFSGCLTPKTVYIHEKPYAFQKVTQPKTRTIRVYKEDVALFKSYINDFRKRIEFMNKQVDDYLNKKEK